MSNKKSYKSCPHCGGTSGFRLEYDISGWGFEERDFNGEVKDAERETFDSTNDHVVCLDCGKHIETQDVKHD